MNNVEKGLLHDSLFIVPLLTFSRSALTASELNTCPPYKYEKNIVLRSIRELFFRFKLPFRHIWYYPVKKKYFCFFLYDGVDPGYVEWLHKQFPQSKFIMCYMNKCNLRNSPGQYHFDYLKIWSGDINDCEKYNLNFICNYGAYSRSWIVKKEKPQYDIFFVGKDKGMKRLDFLLELQRQFDDLGLKSYFHIVANHRYDRYRSIHYKKYLPYEECLKYLGKSKAILYLGYGSQEAITIRIQESLVHKIKLITDCSWIKKFEFYDSENIFIIGEDDFRRLPIFLNTPYKQVDAEILNHMYIEDLLTEIISRS